MSNHPLDNPIWNALSTRQQPFSIGGDLARRFHTAIGPLAGLREQSPEAYAELAQTLQPGQPAFLFLESPPRLPSDWQMIRETELIQMLCPSDAIPPHSAPPQLAALTTEDIPDMLNLVEVTQPGPFGPRTIELGGYLGHKIGDHLAAMAGYRLAPPGYREISAVCTHPDFRGRGLAHHLVATLARHIRAQNEIPFLTARADNTSAIRVYEAAGFILRRSLHFALVTPAAP
ncbi:MAG TPA: GNAT family N-acetyltransferase [Acidobacteriaceae bacterium]|nr:GNAT family N-acetyltransferase [Acidobacteriaceae bacterium]